MGEADDKREDRFATSRNFLTTDKGKRWDPEQGFVKEGGE